MVEGLVCRNRLRDLFRVVFLAVAVHVPVQSLFGHVVAAEGVPIVIVANDLAPVAVEPVLQLDHEPRHLAALRGKCCAQLHAIGQSIGRRRHLVARYADELAEYREREARLAEENDEAEIKERPDDLPDDVPSKATITIKEINDNRYYYWQWREGDTVTSKYKGPVNPDE